MLCVPIQVELIEAFDDPEGTQFIAIGGYVTGTYPRSGPSLYRPYLVCIGEGGKIRSIPVDVLKFVTVLPQAMFVVEPPKGSEIVAVSGTGVPVGVS